MKKILALLLAVMFVFGLGSMMNLSNYKALYAEETSTLQSTNLTTNETEKQTVEQTTKPITYPKGTVIKKIKSAKKSLKVYWKKQAKNTFGYHIQCARKKNFIKLSREIYVENPNKTSIKIRKLKKKKLYYVRIRTYKVVEGKYYHSGWSKVKYKKTK